MGDRCEGGYSARDKSNTIERLVLCEYFPVMQKYKRESEAYEYCLHGKARWLA